MIKINYVPADKLIAEIKRQKHELELSIQSQGDYGQSCHIVAYDNILSLIDSLQQEQPEKGLDVTDFCNPIDPGIAKCIADHWWEMLDGKEPDKSLEEAIRLWAAGVFLAYTFPDTTVKTLREIVEKTFIAGAEWQKEQMKSEAVEASVNTYELAPGGSAYVEFVADMPVARFRSNDKVRILVLKSEEE